MTLVGLMIVGCTKTAADITATPINTTSGTTSIVTTTVVTTSFCPEGTEILTTDLPQAVLDYVTANYPTATIEDAETVDIDGVIHYSVEIGDDTTLLLGEDGTLVFSETGELEPVIITEADLPQAIIDYINTTYPDLMVSDAVTFMEYNHDYTEVELSDSINLIFDNAGLFLCAETETPDIDDGGGNDDDDDSNDNDDDDSNDDDDDSNDDDDDDNYQLPQVIIDWLTANYPDYTVEDADLEDYCSVAQIVVVELISPTQGSLTVGVDLTGNVVYTATDINSSDLPAAVTDGIAVAYPTAVIESDAHALETSTGTQYEVSLEMSNDTEIHVIYAADGTIICEY